VRRARERDTTGSIHSDERITLSTLTCRSKQSWSREKGKKRIKKENKEKGGKHPK
jgi:hypothetical protein